MGFELCFCGKKFDQCSIIHWRNRRLSLELEKQQLVDLAFKFLNRELPFATQRALGLQLL